MKVDLYLWEGSWGPFKIKTKCGECDINVAIFEGLKQKYPELELTVQPWLDNWVKVLLFYRAWHAPVVIINDQFYSQEKIVDTDEVEELLRKKD